jgi:hypothetical protein
VRKASAGSEQAGIVRAAAASRGAFGQGAFVLLSRQRASLMEDHVRALLSGPATRAGPRAGSTAPAATSGEAAGGKRRRTTAPDGCNRTPVTDQAPERPGDLDAGDLRRGRLPAGRGLRCLGAPVEIVIVVVVVLGIASALWSWRKERGGD